jgi:tetraacyldisaccharide 4'-kinase
MRAPDFWWQPKPRPVAMVLRPLAALYGAVAGWRMRPTGFRAPVPVICIGNLSVGGAGKTPTALYCAERLQAIGRQPVFLTRGYGGTLRGPVLVDPQTHGPEGCGDEALLLAARAPTILSADRPAGARLAAQHGDVIVMDDGFQNPSLNKDLTLVVIDSAVGVGNGLCFPAGPLRAPLADQWPKADAVLVIGPGEAGLQVARRSGKPVLTGSLLPDEAVAKALGGQRVLAFAGIGRPEKFFSSLENIGANVVVRQSFPDHYPYCRGEIEHLLERARTHGFVPVITAKDAVKVRLIAPDLMDKITIFPVSLRVDAPERLDALLAKALSRS